MQAESVFVCPVDSLFRRHTVQNHLHETDATHIKHLPLDVWALLKLFWGVPHALKVTPTTHQNAPHLETPPTHFPFIKRQFLRRAYCLYFVLFFFFFNVESLNEISPRKETAMSQATWCRLFGLHLGSIPAYFPYVCVCVCVCVCVEMCICMHVQVCE